MIDPPWKTRMWSQDGYKKSPEAHYATMTLDQIASLPVLRLLKPHGIVWCWMTWPLVGAQSNIMEHAWGVTPQTGGAWAKRTKNGKLRWGPGYIIRSVCEPFVIGTRDRQHGFRGRSQANLIETIEAALVDGLAREHSRKPDEAYKLIEAVTPGWRRADVFSTRDRRGWDAWGDQMGKYNGQDDQDR